MSLAMPLSLQAYSYEEVESWMRTGDVVLYNDSTSSECTRAARAATLSKIFTLLPCNTFLATESHSYDSDENGSSLDDEAQAEIVRDQSWLYWRNAALVVLMADETETNPHGNVNKLIPYVFYVHGDSQCPTMWPLKTLLREVAAGGAAQASGKCAYFALRQLFTGADGRQADAHFCARLRDSLREQILALYRDIMAQAVDEVRRHPPGALQHRLVQMCAALDVFQPPLPQSMVEVSAADREQQRIALFYASSCYLTLYTLYRVNVLRIEPHAATAAAALQEGGGIEQQLSSGYSLCDEISFYYQAKK